MEASKVSLYVGHVLKSAAFMGGDVIGLIAFDFVLGIIFRCVMDMTLVIEVSGMDGDDRPGYPTSLGIPAHVFADLEPFSHIVIPCSFGSTSRNIILTPH
jgi:hypothetical protein